MKKTTARWIRAIGGLLFFIYLLLLIYALFFSESYGRTGGMEGYHYNLVPFREIRRYLQYPQVLGTYAVVTNLVGNIVGFLPFGAILPVLKRNMRSFWKILLLSFEFSAMIEAVSYTHLQWETPLRRCRRWSATVMWCLRVLPTS